MALVDPAQEKILARMRGGRARGTHRQGEMNSTEAKYRDTLQLMMNIGEVVYYSFESIKLRLADKTFYTPDFFVKFKDGRQEFHEVKGYWMEDARIKIKVAASLFPFTFKAFSPRKGGGWEVEEF